MKTNFLKHYLLLFTILLGLIISFNGCSDDDEHPKDKETYVPDDNFEQKLIDLGYDDVLDNYVLTINIQDVEKLNVEELEIKDLTGIQNFESLKYLNCNDNQLTSLDISQNTSLLGLYCNGNQLKSLDVSNNISLVDLYCKQNQLISLDVSKNTSLQFLYCSNNRLKSLNVSYITSLSFFDCQFNQLTSIDVSNNTNLFYFYCQSNHLTNLDVSKNSNISMLVCRFNKITCIKVNESQLNNDVSNWTKDGSSTWSLDCD